ncbi:GNAT family N-acetyltransferase [Desnuesiella massiliensis]|uniref:GNAT family N-acetyltransferase n=1 Tax=Desnuesiella massiliensis TaxID=1650662 RepID=UPI0006E4115F|nr:GNAT family N-acetyltransferase [Desnuesiella massiliensis]
MNLTYKENILTSEDVILFQRKMNWVEDPKAQWEKSLLNTIYSIVAIKDNEIVAMGRLLGDAAIYWYINDVFVLTEYQGCGIGREIVSRLLQYVKESSLSGTEVSVCLMCAKGKEVFYEKLGFRTRPHEYEGAGMEMELVIK